MDTEEAHSLEVMYTCENPNTHEEISLLPDGKGLSTQVTEENKMNYIAALTKHLLCDRVQPYLRPLSLGFFDVFSPDMLKMLSDDQLRTLLSGEQHIDVENLITYAISICFIHHTSLYPCSPPLDTSVLNLPIQTAESLETIRPSSSSSNSFAIFPNLI